MGGRMRRTPMFVMISGQTVISFGERGRQATGGAAENRGADAPGSPNDITAQADVALNWRLAWFSMLGPMTRSI
jgi:hypothetical protein